jgi:hypothetical protein
MQLSQGGGGSWGRPNAPPIDQARLEGLNATAKALARAGFPHNRLLAEMADQIALVERQTGRKVRSENGQSDGVWFTFEVKRPSGDNYVRVRTTPNGVRLLSARVEGVVMSANFMKPGVYDHDNVCVAQALRTLADIIENAPARLADADVELDIRT